MEITGRGGTPGYARAQLNDNGQYHGNPNIWSVKFPKGMQRLESHWHHWPESNFGWVEYSRQEPLLPPMN
jgi:hypothetical protein